MSKMRKPLFWGLVSLLVILIGFAIYLLITPPQTEDHAVPYRNDEQPGPSGFSWKEYPDVGIKFLIPDNWYLDEAMVGTEEYYISKISWEESEIFTTGLAIVVNREDLFPDITGRAFIEGRVAGAHAEEILYQAVERRGKATIRYLEILVEDDWFEATDIRRHKHVYYMCVARPDKHISFNVRFESPAAQWNEEWQKGKVMLDTLQLYND